MPRPKGLESGSLINRQPVSYTRNYYYDIDFRRLDRGTI